MCTIYDSHIFVLYSHFNSNLAHIVTYSLISSLSKEGITVKSTRLQDRRSKKRKVPKHVTMIHENNNSRRKDTRRKTGENLDPNDPLRLFLWGPETTKLLTAEEEAKLIVQVQVCL